MFGNDVDSTTETHSSVLISGSRRPSSDPNCALGPPPQPTPQTRATTHPGNTGLRRASLSSGPQGVEFFGHWKGGTEESSSTSRLRSHALTAKEEQLVEEAWPRHEAPQEGQGRQVQHTVPLDLYKFLPCQRQPRTRVPNGVECQARRSAWGPKPSKQGPPQGSCHHCCHDIMS